MKRIAGILTLLIPLSLISVEPAFSDFSLQNCLSIRNITTTVDGTKISVKADAYQTCSEFTSPNFDGYSPRYSISNLGLFCSGPALRNGRQTFLPVSLGSISCSGTSDRYGTTSSTMSASLGYVNYNVNEVSVRFSHEEIVRVSQRADCIELRSPSSSQTPTLITLKFDVYATCTSGQLGSSLGRNPLYQMTQEESLFNLNSCSGPSVSPLIGSGWLGTATCSLRVGSNTLPSSRTGATSTIIEVKFVWDFSSKTISVPHIAIPAGTNNGWGGTTGGTSTPVVTNCTKAPNAPFVVSTWTEKGPKFQVIPDGSGAKVSNLSYSYSLYDSNTKSWGGWTSWILVNQNSSFVYEPPLMSGKSLIAFAAVSSNSCGSSTQARESKTNGGIPLAPLQEQAISIWTPLLLSSVTVGTYSININSFFRSSSGYQVKLVSKTTDICQVTNQNYLVPSKIGTCTLVASLNPVLNYLKATDFEYSFAVIPKKIQQIVVLGEIKTRALDEGGLTLDSSASSKLPVSSSSDTPDVCKRITSYVYLLSIGTCSLTFSQLGNNTYEPADRINVTFEVVETIEAPKISITCVKGKLTKKVTAVKPKCPTGYKKK